MVCSLGPLLSVISSIVLDKMLFFLLFFGFFFFFFFAMKMGYISYFSSILDLY